MSAGHVAGYTPDRLRARALQELDGVGDASRGEWYEQGRVAFHVRRRLSGAEEEQTGPVLDVRGTPEARRRLLPVLHLLPRGWHEL